MPEIVNQRSLLIREPNEVRILRVVRDSGEISRVEIAKACNLNKAYVTELVTKLINAGFLEETGEFEKNDKVGRKRILLRFLPLAGVVAGIDIGMTHATIALTDLNATILQQETFTYSVETPAKTVLAKAGDSLQKLLSAANYTQAKLVGIGIGVQGLIDYTTNTLMVSHNKKSWEGESLSLELENRFKVPVYVENDVNTMALGEYLLGAAKGIKNCVYLFIGDGLGAGIVINGNLHRGFTSSAGEIGFTEPDPQAYYKEQFPVLFNNQIILGQILNDSNIVESYLRKVTVDGKQKITVSEIANKAMNGDIVANKIIEECSSLLSMLCITLVNTLNPELIIIAGKLSQNYPPLIDMVQKKIRKDILSVPAEAVRVKASIHGDSGVELGVASLVLFEMFEPLHTLSIHASRHHSFIKSKTSKVKTT